jgi:hypothetical protein
MGAQQQPGTRGIKRLTVLALVMAIAFGVAVVVLPSDERIDIGRPLGAMYITFSKKLTYERRGTSAYAVIRKDYDASGKLTRTLQAGIKYLPRPPMGWEDATWPVRAGMVARDLLDAKHPGRTGRTCWVGALQKSPHDWMALPYQQTFYNSEGFADENYRGIFLIFKPPTGGALLLDLFKRRQDVEGIRDWQQVRDYLLEVNEVIHFKDSGRPQLASAAGEPGRDELRKVSIPKSNPLCLGSYLVTLPKGTSFEVAAGGYYQLKDERRDVEAFVSYGEQVDSQVVDTYQVLRPDCRSDLDMLAGGPARSENADTQIRYIRTMRPRANVECKTRRFFGMLATRQLARGPAITFDVFVRSSKDQWSLPTRWWQQIEEYLQSLEQQALSDCEQPGSGNDSGGVRPISLRSPPSGRPSSALRIDAETHQRCTLTANRPVP